MITEKEVEGIGIMRKPNCWQQQRRLNQAIRPVTGNGGGRFYSKSAIASPFSVEGDPVFHLSGASPRNARFALAKAPSGKLYLFEPSQADISEFHCRTSKGLPGIRLSVDQAA